MRFEPKLAKLRGLIVAGETQKISFEQVSELAKKLRWPVLPEPTSAPWNSENFVAHAPLVLQKMLGDRANLTPEVVIAIGRVGLSRPVSELLNMSLSAKYWLSVPPLVTKLDGFTALEELTQVTLDVGDVGDDAWLASWLRQSRAAEEQIKHALVGSNSPRLSGIEVARSLTSSLRDGDLLHLGSSYAARDVEAYAWNEPGSTWERGRLKVFMNRGVNGIDGVVSTAMGEALAGKSTGYLLCGDLTFLHDLNGLLLGADEPRPDLTIVVTDNDGGGIFSTLERVNEPGFERVMAAPVSADIAAICSAMRIPTQVVDDAASLRRELSVRVSGLRVLIARVGSREAEAKLRQSIAQNFLTS